MAKDKAINSSKGDDKTSGNSSPNPSPVPNSPALAATEGSKKDEASPATSQTDMKPPSWSSGSWRGKASAISEIAKDPVVSHTPKALTQSLRRSSKGSPSLASMTRLNITSNGPEESNADSQLKPGVEVKRGDEEMKQTLAQQDSSRTDGTEEKQEETAKERPMPSGSWRGWWSRPRGQDSEPTAVKTPSPRTDSQASNKASQQNIEQPQASVDSTTPSSHNKQGGTHQEIDHIKSKTNEQTQSQIDAKAQIRSSWFGLWGSSAGPRDASGNHTVPKSPSAEPSQSDIAAVRETGPAEPAKAAEHGAGQPPSRPNGSSWAFWSREKDTADSNKGIKADRMESVGEIAVANTSTESKPKATSISSPSTVALQDTKSKKRERPQSSDVSVSSGSNKRSAQGNKQEANATVKAAIAKSNAATQDQAQKSTTDTKISKTQQNLVLPSLPESYPEVQNPSYWQSFSRMIGSYYHHNSHNRLFRSSSPHRPKRALAIGVHGYFPSPLVQKVLGPPTGTSLRFADGAADAIKEWTESRGYNCEIEKIALQGEGVIAERLETLWNLLLNWVDAIRKADFILVACHSQGVPVAINLVAKLLDFKCISSSTRVGICAMAGVNLGPFSSYQSRFFGASANELFEFSRPASTVSKDYENALQKVLKNQVRVVYVGSIDDQLVSLESALFANVAHPCIYRAVFVDGRIHAPGFLSHLVGFACKLRNLGVSDHGLLRELSSPLAGSLYGGEGHSRIYEDEAVYELAVKYALETLSPGGDAAAHPTLEITPYQALNSSNTNPYFLPWAMRGVLEEEYVRKELKNETQELLAMYEKWQPQSKVLKDVKFRLEAVKSKL
ncbi:MAG: hypothetical protein M1831_004288 [Alyxoria varia]|nr:MAG: hypothetical protein M1831_004288 [Alyxoria varia]